MEPTYFERFLAFVKGSFQEKFKVFLPGAIVGLFGAKSLLFAGLPDKMVTIGAYIIKYVGTVIMAFSSGLATAYAAYLIEQYKKKKDVKIKQKKRQNGKAA